MATSTLTRPISIEEFRKIPDPPGFSIELRNGEVFQVSPPKNRHAKIQMRIFRLLDARLTSGGFLGMEVAFQPHGNFEFRVADVAFISQSRFDAIDDEDNLHGSPELVVEVLSPSNTVAEMYEKEALCLGNGALEFWVVDPATRQVRVASSAGPTRSYGEGDLIPLERFSAEPVPAAEIFA
jgi:Uma2 family endonuclease